MNAKANNVINYDESNEDSLILYAGGLTVAEENDTRDMWIIWTPGASQNLCCTKNKFINYEILTNDIKVEVGDGTPLLAEGKGDISLLLNLDGKEVECILENVLHVPRVVHNLISLIVFQRF